MLVFALTRPQPITYRPNPAIRVSARNALRNKAHSFELTNSKFQKPIFSSSITAVSKRWVEDHWEQKMKLEKLAKANQEESEDAKKIIQDLIAPEKKGLWRIFGFLGIKATPFSEAKAEAVYRPERKIAGDGDPDEQLAGVLKAHTKDEEELQAKNPFYQKAQEIHEQNQRLSEGWRQYKKSANAQQSDAEKEQQQEAEEKFSQEAQEKSDPEAAKAERARKMEEEELFYRKGVNEQLAEIEEEIRKLKENTFEVRRDKLRHWLDSKPLEDLRMFEDHVPQMTRETGSYNKWRKSKIKMEYLEKILRKYLHWLPLAALIFFFLDDLEEQFDSLFGDVIPPAAKEVYNEYHYLFSVAISKFRNTFITCFGVGWQDFRMSVREAWLQYGHPYAKMGSVVTRSYFKELGDSVLPPELPEPYKRGYTAVISLEALFGFYGNGTAVEKRPAADLFLTLIGAEYELILWSHQEQGAYFNYAEGLDPIRETVAFTLYRSDCSSDGNMLYKDLSRLNRDLSKVIYVESDHLPLSILKNKENVIVVPKYDMNAEDTTLLDILPFFYDVVLKQETDVRDRIKETQNPEWLDFMFKNRISYLKDLIRDPQNSPWRNLEHYLGFKPVEPLPEHQTKAQPKS